MLYCCFYIQLIDWDDESVAPPAPNPAEVPEPPQYKEEKDVTEEKAGEKEDSIAPLAKKFQRVAYVDGRLFF